MSRILLFTLLLCATQAIAQPLIVAAGTIRHFEQFHSRYIEARNIDVWLPPDYNAKKQYPVLYMHDGQMLFDSNITWNHQEWGVDETMGALLKSKKIKPCIIVGVWNAGKTRHADYFPQKPFEALSKEQQDAIYNATRNPGQALFAHTIQSDQYLRFLVYELKPFIDSVFTTKKKRASTFIAGSSMGGLISMYAVCEYPEVFGGAACLSTHWPGIFEMENNPIPAAFQAYMKAHLPKPGNHKFYFDYGSATLDALYEPLQLQVDQIMRNSGYGPKNWITRSFPGDDHSEKSWRNRLDIPLLFLLGK